MERICPYLALAADHRTVIDGFDPGHRCHAASPPDRLDRSTQTGLCLAEAHAGCERFVDAVRRHEAATVGLPPLAPDAVLPRTRMVLLPAPRRGRLGTGQADLAGRGTRLALGAGAAVLGVAALATAASGAMDGLLGVGATASQPLTAAVSASPTATPTSVPVGGPATAPPTATPEPTAALETPVPTPVATPDPTPTSPPTPRAQTYVVVAGDTLAAIAARFGTSVDAIKSANGLNGDLINIGQVLVIP